MQPSICFISETGRVDRPILDPSVRYRCYHPAESLLRDRHICSIYSAATFYDNPNYDFDIYVFHRPNTARAGFRRTFEILSRLGRTLIADYDDLIFGGETLALESSAVKNRTLDPARAISAFASSLDAMQLFSKVSCSTAPLARRVTEFNPEAEAAVVPNVIPDTMLIPHREARTAFRKRPLGSIGYFAGTKSHNRDFPIIEDVLHRVLCENSSFKLMVVGPVDLPRSIASLPNVVTAQAVNYWRLPHLMSYCNTVVAPLEDSDFNACKSRVKFLEAALAGCRLVASPIPDMTEIGEAHMVLAQTKDDWYAALSSPHQSDDFKSRNLDFLSQNNGFASLKKLGGIE